MRRAARLLLPALIAVSILTPVDTSAATVDTPPAPAGSTDPAVPDSDRLRSEVAELTGTVADLESRTVAAAEDYDEAVAALAQAIVAELRAQARFDQAQRDSRRWRADAERRVRALSRTGSARQPLVAVLGGGNDLHDMAVTIRTTEALLAEDAVHVTQARRALADALLQSETLLDLRRSRVAAQAAADERSRALALSLDQQRDLLGQADADLVAAVDAERRRADEIALARSLARENLARAALAGSTPFRGGAPPDLAAYGNGRIPLQALRPVGNTGHLLWAPAAKAFEDVLAAAGTAGIRIGITDSYRTFDAQVDLAFRKGLYADGGLAAVPGTSDHGWGLSVDLDLDAAAQSWLRANAGRFGFVEDVPREPWHWTFYPNPQAAGP